MKQEYENLLSQINSNQSRLNSINSEVIRLRNEKSEVYRLRSQGESDANRLNTLKQQEYNYYQQLRQEQLENIRLNTELKNLQRENTYLTNQSNVIEQQISQTKEYYRIKQDVTNQINDILLGFRAKENISLNTGIIMSEIMPEQELFHSEAIINSIKKNHIEEFEAIMSNVSDIDFQDKNGKTLLMQSCINTFYHGVNYLLIKDANVNLLDSKGANALIYSCNAPHIKYTKKIAQETIDLNHKADGLGGNAGLHVLVAGSKNILFASELIHEMYHTNNLPATLLSSGFGKFIVDESCSIGAIVLGAEKSVHEEKTMFLISFLTESGADINIQNHQGLTPLFLSYAMQLNYVSDQLVNHPGVNLQIQDNSLWDALSWSLETRNLKLVQQVLDKGLDMNRQDIQGKTTVHWTVIYNCIDIIQELLGRDGKIDITDNNGVFPWHYAAYIGHQPMLSFLYSNIPNIDYKTTCVNQYTGLWIAAERGNLEAVEWMISEGADINYARQSDNRTVLHAAISNLQLPIVQKLIDSNVDINKTDNQGASPLYYSLGYVGQQDVNIIRYLIEHNADVIQNMNDGDTPMHMIGYHHNLQAGKLLLQYGANINVKNHEGKTPLHAAINSQNYIVEIKLNTVKYFLLNSADPNITDNEGNSAIYYAKQSLPEALEYIQHPETLPNISELELNVLGNTIET